MIPTHIPHTLRAAATTAIIAACALASSVNLAAQESGPPIVASITRSMGTTASPITVRLTSTGDSVSVAKVEIFRDGALLQTIEEPGMDDLFFDKDFGPENLEFMVQTEDLTFDGYPDLWLMQWRGAHEVGFNYWLYNPGSGRFEYYKPLSGECGYPDIDSAAKTMSLRCNNGAAGAYYVESAYRFAKGRFTLVRQESQDQYGSKYDKVERITKELRNGKLRVVARKVIRMDDLDKE